VVGAVVAAAPEHAAAMTSTPANDANVRPISVLFI